MKINDHMDITNFAVDLYWLFSPTELADELKSNSGHIREGSGIIKNGALRCKARTMHFFNNKNRFKPKKISLFGLSPIFTLYPTSEHSLRYYIQELRRDISEGISKRGYHLIGKILHLVQDMSSPVNVIPVYHSKKGDSFETRLNHHVSSYLSNFNYNQDRFNLVSKSGLGEECIENIYQGAALQTLEHISSTNSQFHIEIDGETRKAGWDLFWKGGEDTDPLCNGNRPAGINGYGCYGPLGKHFGREQVSVNSNRYVINSRVYDELCNFVIRKSIEDSLKVLICIENQIKRL